MKWIEVNGVGLRYELAGSGEETVVLVHEMGGSLESWDATLPAFQKSLRTLRYDQRGFGQSEKPTGPLALADMVGDIAALLDALAIGGRCHVVGSALGAGIAAAFAIRHPSRVARLVVQSLVAQSSRTFRPQMIERAAETERTGMRPQAKTSLDRSYPDVLRGDRESFEQYRLRWIANDPRAFAAMNRMLLEMDINPELPAIKCPTLAIGCVHDPLRPPDQVKELAAKIPGARYVEADSGHFMHFQTPELFAELAVPFLLGKK
ncbi:MAG TPA: alpha/beta fold hydrolase [Burkholderiales bacterium]|nr:alpha/beta fold hydrolase [Burkholderiales bacterium]